MPLGPGYHRHGKESDQGPASSSRGECCAHWILLSTRGTVNAGPDLCIDLPPAYFSVTEDRLTGPSKPDLSSGELARNGL